MTKCILNRVKELRWMQKMTVIELAYRSGLRQSTVTKIENGDMIPSQIVMMKISKGLGMSVQDVFFLNWKNTDIENFKRRKRRIFL